MRALFAVLYFVLTLIGCQEQGGTGYVARVSDASHDLVYGKAHAEHGRATFECLRSDSGACHFSVFASHCPSVLVAYGNPLPPCRGEPLATMTIAVGHRGETVVGTDDFQLCLSPRAGKLGPDCHAVTPPPRGS